MVKLPAEKVEKLRVEIERLRAGLRIPKSELRSCAGLMSWVANGCPQLTTFLTMIWAALTSRTYGECGHGKQIELPLKWLAAFVSNVNGSLRRHFKPRAAMAMVITFDGSPEGGGATLQLAVPTSAD